MIKDENGNIVTLTEDYINKLPTKEEQETAHQKNRRTEMEITNVNIPNLQIKKKDEIDKSGPGQ
jgi:hypothetical protein